MQWPRDSAWTPLRVLVDSSSNSAGASSSFDSASASSSASSSGDYTLVCQCGYVTSVPHPLMRYFNFLGKTLYNTIVSTRTAQLSRKLSVFYVNER